MKQKVYVLDAGRRGSSIVRTLLNNELVPLFRRDGMIPDIVEKTNA